MGIFSRGVPFIVLMFFRVTVTVTVIASVVDAIWRYVFFCTSIVIEVFGRVQWRQKCDLPCIRLVSLLQYYYHRYYHFEKNPK